MNKSGRVWRVGETVHYVLHLDRMVTGHFPLSELEAAFRSTREPDTMKSIVSPQA